MRLFANLALALSLSFISPSLGHVHQGKRHHVLRQADLARRDPGEIDHYKRDFGDARFTFYAVGLGSCGSVSQPSDFVVAVNSIQYESSLCNTMITISANGLTTQAVIVDLCPGCPVNGLDLSEGLFEFFASLSVGVLTGSWSLGSGGSSPSPSPSPTPTTSVDIPTTTWLPSSTTTTWQPPPTTTTSAPPTTSSSSLSSAVTSSTSSSVSTQTATNVVATATGAASTGTDNLSVLADLNLSIVDLSLFLSACSSLQ